MLNLTELIQAIINYIEDSETEYAIMFDGEWGCGKTYCWKNEIVPILKQQNIKYIYVSLYSLNKIEELDDLMLGKLLSIYNQTLNLGMFKGLTDLLNSAIPKVKINIDTKQLFFKFIQEQLLNFTKKQKLVFCFDDLERANIDNNQILGYINQFVEHYQIKTIVICNESELNKSNSNYVKTKEKIIGYTFKLSPSIEKIIEHFIKNYPEPSKSLLKKYKSEIVEITRKSKLKNLRILKNCLSISKKVFQELGQITGFNIDSLNNGLNIDFYAHLLYFIFSINIEIKEGRAKQEELKLLEQWSEQGYDFTYRYYKKTNKTENEVSFLSNFLWLYYGDYLKNYITSRAIYDYMINGYFDCDLFRKEIDKINNSQEDPRKIFLQNFSQLTDDEFAKISREFIDDVKNDKINLLSDLLRIYDRLSYFAKKRLIQESHQEIFNLFQETILRQSNTKLFKFESFNYFDNFVEDRADRLDNELKQIIIEFNQKAHENFLVSEVNRLINHLKSNSDIFFVKAYEYNRNMTPIFNYINISALYDGILSLSNSDIRSLQGYIHNRYKFSNIGEYFATESENLKQLSSLLKSHLQNSNSYPKKLSHYFIDNLADEIDRVVERLQ